MPISTPSPARRVAALACAVAVCAAPAAASAFCGFYVSDDARALYSDATHVVLMRAGTRTVLSIQSRYRGPPRDFALVIPVPVAVRPGDVRTLPAQVLARVDRLAAPRLVEFWEQDPCTAEREAAEPGSRRVVPPATAAGATSSATSAGGAVAVTVEAAFAVGEYEIAVLSATEALALERWLAQHGYRLPAGAAPYLRPYIEAGSKFFVARVDASKVEFQDGRAWLSPLRVHYDSETFALPIRLGLINADAAQDLIIHILAPQQRYEVANYPNVTIPTNAIVSDQARDRFDAFYAALLDATRQRAEGAVVTEYAWDARTCDPCPDAPLGPRELLTLGLDVVFGDGAVQTTPRAQVGLGRPMVTGAMDRDLIARVLRRRLPALTACYQDALARDPTLAGQVTATFAISPAARVLEAAVAGLDDPAASRCLADVIRNTPFPKNGGVHRVRLPLALRATAPDLPDSVAGRSMVLTRLHTRYTPDAVGRDLVFRAAPPIRGGQGGATPGDKGAQRAAFNAFQGRYIVRNPWTGPIQCPEPIRGVWGGPPRFLDPAPAVARVAAQVAFAPRGDIDLAQIIRDPLARIGLAHVAAPKSPPTPAASKADTRAPAKRGGCAAGGPAEPAAIALALLVWAASLRRRRWLGRARTGARARSGRPVGAHRVFFRRCRRSDPFAALPRRRESRSG